MDNAIQIWSKVTLVITFRILIIGRLSMPRHISIRTVLTRMDSTGAMFLTTTSMAMATRQPATFRQTSTGSFTWRHRRWSSLVRQVGSLQTTKTRTESLNGKQPLLSMTRLLLSRATFREVLYHHLSPVSPQMSTPTLPSRTGSTRHKG